MTFIRSLIFAVYFLAGSTLLAFLYLPTLVLPRNAIRLCVRFWGVYVAFGLRAICGVRTEIRGREHMPQGAALIAAKHQSMLDVTGSFSFLPDSCFVMKKQLLKIPLFGWYCLKVGMVPLDRDGRMAALKKLVADVQDRFKDTRQVVIFPEGTRITPGEAGNYQSGVAALYRELDMPCHLVATNSGVHWAGSFWRKPGVVVFEFLEPIPPGLKAKEFMAQMQTRIETASLKLYEDGI